ncbi:MAG: hypothetical protein HYR96_03440 [Deltaproteobacteria bacterium]|nr:hypothetical protein [Deltaproteobacteria bacterium]MBI3295455.1 hypothetical protein [Deltaproteobacteria bacterium]
MSLITRPLLGILVALALAHCAKVPIGPPETPTTPTIPTPGFSPQNSLDTANVFLNNQSQSFQSQPAIGASNCSLEYSAAASGNVLDVRIGQDGRSFNLLLYPVTSTLTSGTQWFNIRGIDQGLSIFLNPTESYMNKGALSTRPVPTTCAVSVGVQSSRLAGTFSCSDLYSMDGLDTRASARGDFSCTFTDAR